jgi:predicted AAA+ superfamily ATPase
MIFRPAYFSQLQKWINTPQIKIITGIRRSGKSSILLLLKAELLRLTIREQQIISLNFESFATESLKNAPALYAYLQSKIQNKQKHYILLDEIQEVAGWEKVVNSLMVDYDVDIYLTGSNSHLLSSELATYLAGRYVEIPIYTLSYKEFLDFKKEYAFTENSSSSSFVE